MLMTRHVDMVQHGMRPPVSFQAAAWPFRAGPLESGLDVLLGILQCRYGQPARGLSNLARQDLLTSLLSLAMCWSVAELTHQ